MVVAIPHWLPAKWNHKWLNPWTVKRSRLSDVRFKHRLRKHGYLSPHFTISAARSGDGVEIPGRLLRKAQRHAFRLEHVRHGLGDHPLTPLDWYRSPAHNRDVDGVPNSEHLEADATDWGPQRSQAGFNQAMRTAFANGGIGSGGSSGNVQHVDDGGNRRWVYPGR